MKKNTYHVNPVVNKWEEEQRRARMEKMISRAKSTLPPEARAGNKQAGPKKPSPYAAESNAARVGRKQSSNGQDAAGGPVVMDVQELDSLIYNRVQEILGMPLMRRAAAARGAAGKGGSPPQAPMSARGGARRPVWNSEWSAPAASAPAHLDARQHAGGVAARSAPAGKTYERIPSKPTSTASGNARRHNPDEGTPTRQAAPKPADAPHAGAVQRRPSGRAQGAAERVVLLPSPSVGSSANRAQPVRPSSSRYGTGLEPGAAAGGAGGQSHLLGQSVVSAIVALNPHSPEAQEAAARIAKHPQRGQPGTLGAASSAAGSSSAGRNAGRPSSLIGGAAGAAGSQRGLSSSASVHGGAGSSSGGGGGGGRDGGSMKSLASKASASASQGGSPGSGSGLASARRPPVGPGGRSSGSGASPAAGAQASPVSKGDEEEEDAYGDDFEEYDGSDGEGAAARGEAEDGEQGPSPDVAMLRSSVSALNGLVQLKIQQELARSQQRQSQLGGSDGTTPTPSAMLASMALVGADDADAPGHGLGHGDLGASGLEDGLRQSDLDYLARLGGGDPHDGHEGGSGDERTFVIEPGAPAGTNKTWGDRQPWADGKGDGGAATGLEQLRARQEKERVKQQQEQGVSPSGQERRQGRQGGGISVGQRQSQQGEAGRRSSGVQEDEEDSVLLGETLTPRHRTGGAAAQMQAVSSALAALATSGQLTTDDAQDLQTQTDALYGSLVQLHNLMTGPRGAELKTSPPSGADGTGGDGFSPLILSPIDSPSQSIGGSPLAPEGGGNPGASRGTSARPQPLSPAHMEPTGHRFTGEPGESSRAMEGVPGGERGGGGSHIQLTPKHRLVAQDVAWMAGLAQSLSDSLQIENGDLPGM